MIAFEQQQILESMEMNANNNENNQMRNSATSPISNSAIGSVMGGETSDGVPSLFSLRTDRRPTSTNNENEEQQSQFPPMTSQQRALRAALDRRARIRQEERDRNSRNERPSTASEAVRQAEESGRVGFAGAVAELTRQNNLNNAGENDNAGDVGENINIPDAGSSENIEGTDHPDRTDAGNVDARGRAHMSVSEAEQVFGSSSLMGILYPNRNRNDGTASAGQNNRENMREQNTVSPSISNAGVNADVRDRPLPPPPGRIANPTYSTPSYDIDGGRTRTSTSSDSNQVQQASGANAQQNQGRSVENLVTIPESEDTLAPLATAGHTNSETSAISPQTNSNSNQEQPLVRDVTNELSPASLRERTARAAEARFRCFL